MNQVQYIIHLCKDGKIKYELYDQSESMGKIYFGEKFIGFALGYPRNFFYSKEELIDYLKKEIDMGVGNPVFLENALNFNELKKPSLRNSKYSRFRDLIKKVENKYGYHIKYEDTYVYDCGHFLLKKGWYLLNTGIPDKLLGEKMQDVRRWIARNLSINE